MYHITFLFDEPDLVHNKLRHFVSQDLTAMWLSRYGEDRQVQSLGDLPTPAFVYQDCWLLHGPRQQTSDTLPSLPEHPLYYGTSFEEINTLFHRLVAQYEWALLPWGGIATYASVAFLTAQAQLLERFLTCSANTLPLVLGPPTSGVITSYTCEALEEVCSALVFQEPYRAKGMLIWDVCECDLLLPCIVYHEYDDEDNMTFSWPGAHFDVLDTFSLPGEGTRRSLYRPRDMLSFLVMCNPQTCTETLMVFPGTTALEDIRQVVTITEGAGAVADLHYLSTFIQTSPWCYALNRGHDDVGYALFVTRDRSLLYRLLQHANPRRFRLVSCF